MFSKRQLSLKCVLVTHMTLLPVFLGLCLNHSTQLTGSQPLISCRLAMNIAVPAVLTAKDKRLCCNDLDEFPPSVTYIMLHSRHELQLLL